MTSAVNYRDDSSWAYHTHKPAEPQEDATATLASTAVAVKRPTTVPDQASDALTGLLLTSPMKKARTGGEAGAVAGYSPELTKALKSVVKIFTTMARCVGWANVNHSTGPCLRPWAVQGQLPCPDAVVLACLCWHGLTQHNCVFNRPLR